MYIRPPTSVTVPINLTSTDGIPTTNTAAVVVNTKPMFSTHLSLSVSDPSTPRRPPLFTPPPRRPSYAFTAPPLLIM